MELSCRYSVQACSSQLSEPSTPFLPAQALDVGQLSLTAPPGKKPAAPLTTLGSSGQEQRATYRAEGATNSPRFIKTKSKRSLLRQSLTIPYSTAQVL